MAFALVLTFAGVFASEAVTTCAHSDNAAVGIGTGEETADGCACKDVVCAHILIYYFVCL